MPTAGAPGSEQLKVEITDIRPATAQPAGAAAAEPSAPSANQPASPQDRTASPSSLSVLIGQLEKDIDRQPPEVDDQLRLRLLYLAAGQDDKAAGPVEGLDPVRAQLLSAIVKTVAAARRAMHQPVSSQATSTQSAALGAVDDLRRLISQQVGVVIPRIALVTRVTSFGDYEEITPLRFPAGQAIHAYLYTEVANFRSEPTEDGRLKTSLSQTVEVFNAAGECVWQRTAGKLEGLTRTPRHDFFIPFPLQLPAETPPGEYVLKATIEDVIGATTDQQRLAFTVVRKGSTP